MRYVTVEMRPTEGSFHPLSKRLRTEPSIERRAIHQVEELDDGTILLEGEVRGDLDRMRAILADSEYVLDHAVFGDQEGYSYSRYEPNELVSYLIERRRKNELMIDWPITYTDDGAQRITLVGHDEAFARARTDAPEGVEMDVVEVGTYRPDEKDLYATLTARQQEVLELAVDRGYYQTPREVTHEDLAEDLDCSPATVGEHLRKIERRVFAAVVG